MKHFKILILISFLLLFLTGTAYGESNISGKLFSEALVCYGELDFETALKKLIQAKEVEQKTETDKYRLTEILKYTAFVHVALGKTPEARESFRQIFVINHEFSLSQNETSPKIFNLYQQVKEESARNTPKQIEPPKEVKPKKNVEEIPKPIEKLEKSEKPVDLLFGFSASMSFLLHPDDIDTYHPGLMLEAYAGKSINKYILLGGDLVYQWNKEKAGSNDLHLMAMLFQVGFLYNKDKFYLHLPLGIGPAAYGRGTLFANGGLMWKVSPSINWQLKDNIALGFTISPSGVIGFAPLSASWILSGGISVITTW